MRSFSWRKHFQHRKSYGSLYPRGSHTSIEKQQRTHRKTDMKGRVYWKYNMIICTVYNVYKIHLHSLPNSGKAFANLNKSKSTKLYKIHNISQSGNLPQIVVKKTYLKPPPSRIWNWYVNWYTVFSHRCPLETLLVRIDKTLISWGRLRMGFSSKSHRHWTHTTMNLVDLARSYCWWMKFCTSW